MSVMCSGVHVALGTVGPTGISGPLTAHVERCAGCAREYEGVMSMADALARLDPVAHQAPPGLHTAVMDSVGPAAVPDTEHRSSLAVPVAAAAFVATAAAGTAVLIRLRRQSAA